jgi:hypothetical protein
MLYENIIKILKENNISFDEIEHIETTSCDMSKQLRKEQWLEWIWSKNLVFHCKGNFYIVITLWDKQIKARNFKKEFWSKNIRFAVQEEITEQINGTIGCIPSFWFDNKQIPIFVDAEIFDNEYFIFNPWLATKSIRLKTSDLEKIYKNMKNPVKYFDDRNDNFKILENL